MATQLEWHNVKSAPYNATGDGATNDRAAIQAAVDAAAAAGSGTVYLPPGTYLVGSAVNLKSNVTFRGDGPATSLTRPNAAARYPILGLDSYDAGRSQIHIRDLWVVGNKANNGYVAQTGPADHQAGICWRYVTDGTITNVVSRDNPGVGVSSEAGLRNVMFASRCDGNGNSGGGPVSTGAQWGVSAKCKIIACHFENNERYGIQFFEPSGIGETQIDNVIAYCTSKGNGGTQSGYGMSFTGGRRNKIIGCASEADNGGFVIANSEDCVVEGCTARATYGTANAIGIYVTNAPRVKVIGNSIDTTSIDWAGSDGIQLDTTSGDATVIGNSVKSAKRVGIYIDGNNTVIQGNYVKSSGGGGIKMGDTAKYNKIIGNVILDSVGNNDGIFATGAGSHCQIIDNTLSGNFKGINIVSSYWQIRGNLIRNNRSQGLSLAGSTRCIVQGNTFIDDQGTPTQTYGVQETGAANNNLITQNIAFGNTTGQIAIIGTNSIANNNSLT